MDDWNLWDDDPQPEGATTALLDAVGESSVDDPLADAPAGPVPGQVALFEEEFRTVWQEWEGMPEFVQEEIGPWAELVVKFASLADRQAFSELLGQPIRSEQYSIWYPQIQIGSYWDKRFRDASGDAE